MGQSVSKIPIAVVGATGATGRLVVAQALRLGHHVSAIVRRAGSFEPVDGLQESVWPDVTDHSGLAHALRHTGAVISAIGGAERGPTSVCANAMRTTVSAMETAGVRRLVAVSAHGVLDSRDGSLYSRAVWRGVGERMKDKEQMEPIIVRSPLDWTIVRPPKLSDRSGSTEYQVGEDLPIRLWSSIGREALASFLLREAITPRFVRGYPRILR